MIRKKNILPIYFAVSLAASAGVFSCAKHLRDEPSPDQSIAGAPHEQVQKDKAHAPLGDGSQGNLRIANFNQAKKIARRIFKDHPVTVYCPCPYSGKRVDIKSCNYLPKEKNKRALTLEWEHVVPAEAFGHAFPEWHHGGCQKGNGQAYRGRRCAQKNPLFARMEADLYNLWPIIGDLNAARSNLSMAELGDNSEGDFGACRAKIRERKFSPMDEDKGLVARTYMYMDWAYPGHGIISSKNEKLFMAWDRQYPVSAWECERARRIEAVQKNPNPILTERCRNRSAAGS